jgi:hypothetical protein
MEKNRVVISSGWRKSNRRNGLAGSIELNGVIGTFHRPHPQKEAKPYQVRDAQAFLEKAGVLP